MRRAISAIKKRTGPHEHTIRELHLESRRIEVGEALREFQGVLSGTPRFVGKGASETPQPGKKPTLVQNDSPGDTYQQHAKLHPGDASEEK